MFDPDDVINDAFADFTTAAAPRVQPRGAAAVHTAVRYRRRARAVGLGVLALLLVVAPVAAYAAVSRGGQHMPVRPGPSPSATVSPSPSGTPSPSPSASPSLAARRVTVSTGELTIAQLTAGAVTIPAWLVSPGGICRGGMQTLTRGTGRVNRAANMVGLQVYQVAYTNLDNDSALETAALITCQYGEAAEGQIVAFDRDASGHIATLGKVAEGHIWSLEVAATGGVTVDMSDMQACCETPHLLEIHQRRTYGWNGSGYVQTGGPTTFISHGRPDSFQFTLVQATPRGAVYQAPDGTPTQNVAVTLSITNTGAYQSQQLAIWDGLACICQTGPAFEMIPGLAPGASETVTLVLQRPASDTFALASEHLRAYEMGSTVVYPDTADPIMAIS